jgi:hypothetical protein
LSDWVERIAREQQNGAEINACCASNTLACRRARQRDADAFSAQRGLQCAASGRSPYGTLAAYGADLAFWMFRMMGASHWVSQATLCEPVPCCRLREKDLYHRRALR